MVDNLIKENKTSTPSTEVETPSQAHHIFFQVICPSMRQSLLMQQNIEQSRVSSFDWFI